jgi:DNA-binding XRE family transcriptional regulator
VGDVSTIGDRLRALRRGCGLSQEQLAEKSGVDLGVIRGLEQHRRTGTRLDTAGRLAAALGASIDDLLGGAGTSAPASWTTQAERDRELGARIRQLLAACGMSPRELEAVLSAGMPGVPQAKRATLAEQVMFQSGQLEALRAEVRALAGLEGEQL